MTEYRIVPQGNHYLVVEVETRRIKFTSASAIEATRYKARMEREARIAEQLNANEPVRWRGMRSGG